MFNVLLGAMVERSPRHAVCRGKLERLRSRPREIALSELILAAVVRIGSNPRAFQPTPTPEEVFRFVEALTSQPKVRRIEPSPRHWSSETEAAARKARTGSKPLGVAAILGKHPHYRPARLKKSPAPLFHAVRQSVRQGLYEGYAWFVAAFRQAAEKLRAGDRSAAFPAGCFPPALPFVGG